MKGMFSTHSLCFGGSKTGAGERQDAAEVAGNVVRGLVPGWGREQGTSPRTTPTHSALTCVIPSENTGLVVVDASLAAMWVMAEPYTSQALALAADWAWNHVQAIAPHLMMSEVASALYKCMRRGELTLQQAVEALHVVYGFGVRLEGETGLHERALFLAQSLDRSAPYDALYLALAEHRGCQVWHGIYALSFPISPLAIYIGDAYPPGPSPGRPQRDRPYRWGMRISC